jgi:hypothetical protein
VAQKKVTGVQLKHLKSGEESDLACAGVFVAIGHVPNTQLFKGIINMDENGYIIPKQGMETNVPGVIRRGRLLGSCLSTGRHCRRDGLRRCDRSRAVPCGQDGIARSSFRN